MKFWGNDYEKRESTFSSDRLQGLSVTRNDDLPMRSYIVLAS